MKYKSTKGIDKTQLIDLYQNNKKSVSQISKILECSDNKINYWLKKFSIKKRTISEAIYQFKNPKGDPFFISEPKVNNESFLFGLGLGLYWGEGDKRGRSGVRLANTDVKLVRKFINFLETFCGINKNKLRFGLQIFSDISPDEAKNYWRRELQVSESQFYKTMILKIRGTGTYKYKSKFGVIILYFNNIKLQKIIIDMIDNIQ